MIKNYIVRTAKHKFYMSCKYNEIYVYIKFGGRNPKKTCIEIFLYKDRVSEKYTYGKMAQVNYDIECNLEGNLKHGIGTKDMICAALISIKCMFNIFTKMHQHIMNFLKI